MKLQLTLLQRSTFRTRVPYNAELKLRQPSYNAVLLQVKHKIKGLKRLKVYIL